MELACVDGFDGAFLHTTSLDLRLCFSDDKWSERRVCTTSSFDNSNYGCNGAIQTGGDAHMPELPNLRSLPLNSDRCHGRAILVFEQAQEIFRYKSISFAKERDKAGILARVYGVSVKTIRDIWVGRTWYRATFHLDPSKPISPERLMRRAGRPKGAKDSTPRARKLASFRTELESDFNTAAFCNTTSEELERSGCNLIPQHASAPPVYSKLAEQERDVHPVSGWLDFPNGMPAEGFEDPFLEDWTASLLYPSTAH